ncbi:DUF1611 domain-containing protein [Zhihengliuella salsuginis]|uniref:DUF1611 domain-containing protein n=1 Tax=Zhihengliuella salsuginis TaxID=578222 RepID=A0ABQ3GL76_9MICC|nr:DUF1611 domain-containing protein [Zhihengliuella salsuginis]GHD12939.1 DUF1611 domain-containing protein [Zhihengliuella salsuginis]
MTVIDTRYPAAATENPAGGVSAALEPGIHEQDLAAERLVAARAAYTTRFVAGQAAQQPFGYRLRSGGGVVPRAGDVVLARVLEIGQHKRLESPVSRKALLFPGQEILVAYGHRYAPDQFLAHVPSSLEPCDLVAGGGLASSVREAHARVDEATRIEPIGLLCDGDGVVTLRDRAPLQLVPAGTEVVGAPPVFAVLGSSMNSGKSTTAACLVNGLTNAGLTVSAGKVTGTGAGNDVNLFRDAGAARVIDFTDFGYPTTFQTDYAEVCRLLSSTVSVLAGDGPDAIVLEIADGIFQGETARLLRDPLFHRLVGSTLFAAQDALGALAGSRILRESGVDVAAISGVVTASPLAAAEAAGEVPERIIGTFDLCADETASGLLAECGR